MKLSIIIPVYNVEQYLGDCLHSVFSTEVASDDYEVIIVNDGTPDRSMSVVHDVCEGHRNVRIVEQENQGLSAARMAGLGLAKGDYVWFVDSDDYLAPGAISQICQAISQESNYVISFPLNIVESSGSHLDYIYHDGVFKTKAFMYSPCFCYSAVRYVIPRQLFDNQNLFFPKGLLHEDIYFCLVLSYLAKGIRVMNGLFYNYRFRNGSIMRSIGEKNINDMVANYKLVKSFRTDNVAKEDKAWFMHIAFCSVLLRCYDYAWASQNRILFGYVVRKYRFYFVKEYLLFYQRVFRKELVGDLLFILFPDLYMRFLPEYRVIQ